MTACNEFVKELLYLSYVAFVSLKQNKTQNKTIQTKTNTPLFFSKNGSLPTLIIFLQSY